MTNTSAADDLRQENVRPALATRHIGRPYLYRPTLPSTNDALKEMAADPTTATGTVLLADYQSSGRGRMGRRWEAPPGAALLFSTLLRPDWPPRQAAWLTMLAGLAVAEAIESTTDLTALLKWPNDVLLQHRGEWRKVCGLLLDISLDPAGRVQSAVLGIGLNVNIPDAALPDLARPAGAVTPPTVAAPPATDLSPAKVLSPATVLSPAKVLSPTSLLAVSGRTIPRLPLLVNLLLRLEHHVDAALGGRSPAAAWSERLITLGNPVRVTTSGTAEPLLGVAESVDEWGCLQVRDADGILHTIAAGDVTLR